MIDVLWALETVYLNKPPSRVLTSRQQMCLLCVCMDQYNTITLLIKALPPLIYTWPQEPMGGCHEEDPLHQDSLKPSGDSISRSHDRNAQWRVALELISRREKQTVFTFSLDKGGGSYGVKVFGMFGFWNFSHGLGDKRTYTPNRDRRDQVPPGVLHQGFNRQRQCETGPEKDFRMVLRCTEKCIFENHYN